MSKGRGKPLYSPMARMAAVAAMAIPSNWLRPPGAVVDRKRNLFRAFRPSPPSDPSGRRRADPQWVQDAKIAAAGEKRMRRRLRPQGSAS